MQKINVKDEFSEEELDIIQPILFMCKDLEEVKSLGDEINLTKVESNTPLTYGIDNGKELKYMKITYFSNNLYISFYEGNYTIEYHYDPETREFDLVNKYNQSEMIKEIEQEIRDIAESYEDEEMEDIEGDYNGKER